MWYGLSLDPPDNAAVFSFDEKSSVQALDRTHPGLPLKKVRCGTMTHDYKRHGTTSERRLVRAQATCPHCEMRATGAGVCSHRAGCIAAGDHTSTVHHVRESFWVPSRWGGGGRDGLVVLRRKLAWTWQRGRRGGLID